MSYTLVLFAHPQLARSALVARPSDENYLRLVERILDLLSRSGASREQVAWGVDKLLQDATATAAEHSTREHDPTAEDDWNATVRALGAVDEATHPAIAAHCPLSSAALSGIASGGASTCSSTASRTHPFPTASVNGSFGDPVLLG